jgi:hypothetical protein
MKNDALYRSFDNIPTRRGRGGVYSYIRWQDVSDRMNEVFGTNWSSEVMSESIVGTNVIIRVRVSVINPDNDFIVYQEGYGGAVNDDRAEAGNSYKSAYSKALKDACKKWGVGLFMEDDSEGYIPEAKSVTIPDGYSGRELGVPPGVIMEKQVKEEEIVSITPTIINTTVEEEVVEDTLEDDTQVDDYNGGSSVSATIVTGGIPLPPSVYMNSTQVSDSFIPEPPIKSNGMIPPPLPSATQINDSLVNKKKVNVSNNVNTDDKVSNINIGGPEYISDVQKAALNGLLSIKGVDYESLAKEAFEANGIVKNPIPDIDKLTYQEAVHIVRHGNDKFRKR